MYFRFLDADSIENFEVSSKFHREQLVMCSAWKLMVKRDFPWIYKDVKFEEKYQEHLFYKKKYRMYKFVGHDCDTDCYNLCNICLVYTCCTNIVFCNVHSWSDYLTK